MKKTVLIIACAWQVLSCTCISPSIRKAFTYHYTDTYTCIDTLIDIEGYYSAAPAMIFYSNSLVVSPIYRYDEYRTHYIRPLKKTERDFDGNTVTTTYSYNTSTGYLEEEKVDYGNGMNKTLKYSDYIMAGKRYQPQTVTLTQKHTDDGNAFSKTTAISYDIPKGYKKQVVENKGTDLQLTTDYTYDTLGNLKTSKISGAGISPVTSHFDYEPTKRFVSKTYTTPASHVNSFAYDTWGNMLIEKDETNPSRHIQTSHKYNDWGVKTSTVLPDGRKTVFSTGWGRQAAKRFWTLTQGAGIPWVKTWYDNTGREILTETVGEKGMTVKKTKSYNSKGELYREISQTGDISSQQTYVYDARGRITSMNDNTLGRSVSYTYNNRKITTKINGSEYVKTFDAWGNVKTSSDPAASVSYTYKSNGQPASVNAAGVTFSMEYDAAGNRTKLVDPDAGTISCKYNAAGRLTVQTDSRGKKTEIFYDNLNRLTYSIVDGVRTDYAYGVSGNEIMRPVRQQTGNNSVSWTYDGYGRIATETRQIAGGGTFSFSYAYDAKGQLGKTAYPGDLSVTYLYDAYGNLEKVQAGAQTVWELTQNTGLSRTATLGGGALTAVETRNSQGLLTNIKTLKGASAIHGIDYEFNGATGNLKTRKGMDGSESFDYDVLDRLKTVNSSVSGNSKVINY
ncbi:MAG: hypothetical protein LBG92_04290, partial [Prevotellaceae bacterium]|nr:hypothetical protein [Prevotellaceae bacterium]